MDAIIGRLLEFVLTSESSFASGILLSLLLAIYSVNKIYRAFSKFFNQYLDMVLERKKNTDSIENEKDMIEVAFQKLALDALKQTNENKSRGQSND